MLAELFSGKHAIAKKNEMIYVDRAPLGFNMMIDFIRNKGQLHEQQMDNSRTLFLELEYWGIDPNHFKDQPKDKFKIIQSIFDRPVHGFFQEKQGSEFFFQTTEANKFNFQKYWTQGNFKFKSDFEIKSIKEIVEIAHGENYKKVTQIGRILGMDSAH